MTDTLAALKQQVEDRIEMIRAIAEDVAADPALKDDLDPVGSLRLDGELLGRTLAVAERLERELSELREIASHIGIFRAQEQVNAERAAWEAERDALRAANGRLREAILALDIEAQDHDGTPRRWCQICGWHDGEHTDPKCPILAALAQDDAPQGGTNG